MGKNSSTVLSATVANGPGRNKGRFVPHHRRTPTIVAVIALYDGGAFIEQALTSVLAQTLPPDEIVVVDDGSRDEGPQIVARLSENCPRIRLIRKQNGGQSSARNLGVACSKSDLIAFLDQDDTWYPDHLAALVRPFRQHRGAAPLGWVYGDLDRVDTDGRPIVRSLLRTTAGAHPKRSLAQCLGDDMLILPSASLIARTAFEAVGRFDETLSGYEDDDLFLRLFRGGYGNEFVDQALSTWRRHAASCSGSPRMARSRRIYAAKLFRTFPDAEAHNRELVARRFFHNTFSRYVIALDEGDHAEVAEVKLDLGRLVPHLPFRPAMVASALRAVIAVPGLGRPLLRTVRLARSLTRSKPARQAVSAPVRPMPLGHGAGGLLAGSS